MVQRFVKIRATTLEEAYRQMRGKYGPDAVVVNTGQVREAGLLGFFTPKLVEITACVSEPLAATPPRRPTPIERKYAASSGEVPPARARDIKYFEQVVRDAQVRMKGGSTPAPPAAPDRAAAASLGGSPVVPFPERRPSSDETAKALNRDLQEIREMMQVLYAESPGAGLPTEFAPHYRMLVERGVSRKVAAALIGAVVRDSDLSILRNPRAFVERLHFEIRRIVEVNGGIALRAGRCRVVALCGATGVGKSTTIAKLAAHFAVKERARVALLTADTYRIAALEQLRVYANIIGVPLRVGNDAKELQAALHEFRDYDLVLLDTAGGSQFNLEQIKELQLVISAARPHETILVMSAGTQLEDLRNIVSNFKCLSPTSVIFTKLDETAKYGAMLSILLESGLALSYLSDGQNVPDDIHVATPGVAANLILEGRTRRD